MEVFIALKIEVDPQRFTGTSDEIKTKTRAVIASLVGHIVANQEDHIKLIGSAVINEDGEIQQSNAVIDLDDPEKLL